MIIVILTTIIVLVLSIIMNLPLILPIVYTIAYHVAKATKHIVERDNTRGKVYLPKLTIQIPTKGENPKYIIRNIHSILSSNYPKDKLEIVIISDDERHTYLNIVNTLRKILSRRGLDTIKTLWRETPRGGKAGALNDSLHTCSGDYIVVLDVDSIVDRNYFKNIVRHVSGKRKVVMGTWLAANTRESILSEALALTQEFMFTTYYKYRYKLSLLIMFAGSGCLIDKSVFDSVGLWDTSIVLEDVEFSLRLLLNNYEVAYTDKAKIYLDVPSNYKSLLIQQSKWAYGSVQLLRKYFKYIITSKSIPWYKKVDILLYIAQYMSSLSIVILSILIPVLILLNLLPPIALSVFYSILFSSMTLYSILYLRYGLKRGIGLIRTLRFMGRVSSILTFIAPRLALSSLKALLNLNIPRIPTPKGVKAYKYSISDLRLEISWFLLLLLLVIVLLLKYGSLYYVLWHLMLISGYLYVFKVMIERKI